MDIKGKAFSLEEVGIPVISAKKVKVAEGVYIAFIIRTMVWDSEKQCSISTNQMVIGRLPIGETTGKIIFNQKFLDKYPIAKTVEVHRIGNGKYVAYKLDKRSKYFKNKDTTKYEDLIFKRGVKRFNPSDKEGSRRSVGVSYVVNKMANKSGIREATQKVLGDKLTEQLLSVSTHMISESSNTFNNIEDLAQFTWLNFQGINNTLISRLFQKITSSDVSQIINNFIKYRLANHNHKYYFVAVDGSSITSLSKKALDAEYGKNKDGDNEKQVNIMFITEQTTAMTIGYRVYPGNVPDTSSFKYSCKQLLDAASDMMYQNGNYVPPTNGSYPEIVVVVDRGITSLKNIQDVMDANIKIIGNLSFRNNSIANDAVVKALEAKIHEEKEDMMISMEERLYHHRTICTCDKKHNLYLHVYFSAKIYLEQKIKIYDDVVEVCKVLNSNNNNETSLNFLEKNKDLFVIKNQDNGETKYSCNIPAINEVAKEKAFRVLCTNIPPKDISPLEIYQTYKERNSCEVAFHQLKQFLSCYRIHTGNRKTLDGKFLAVFFTLVILQELHLHMRDAKSNSQTSNIAKKYLKSTQKLITMLKSIQATLGKDDTLIIDEVVGYKKQILDLLGIPLPTTNNTEDVIDIDAELTENYTSLDAIEEGLFIKNRCS